jgi:hypothetical protein
MFPKMSLRTVKNYVKKLEKEQEDKRLGTLVLSSSTTTISSITTDGASESTDHASADSSDASSESEQSTFASSDSSTEEESIKNLGGHPKGTTAAASHEIQKNELATNTSMQMIKELKDKMRREGARVQKGALADIIKPCKN